MFWGFLIIYAILYPPKTLFCFVKAPIGPTVIPVTDWLSRLAQGQVEGLLDVRADGQQASPQAGWFVVMELRYCCCLCCLKLSILKEIEGISWYQVRNKGSKTLRPPPSMPTSYALSASGIQGEHPGSLLRLHARALQSRGESYSWLG